MYQITITDVSRKQILTVATTRLPTFSLEGISPHDPALLTSSLVRARYYHHWLQQFFPSSQVSITPDPDTLPELERLHAFRQECERLLEQMETVPLTQRNNLLAEVRAQLALWQADITNCTTSAQERLTHLRLPDPSSPATIEQEEEQREEQRTLRANLQRLLLTATIDTTTIAQYQQEAALVAQGKRVPDYD